MVTLRDLGYSLYSSDISRHTRLRYAIEKIGYTKVLHKLKNLQNLYKNRIPILYHNAQYDIKWLKSNF